MDCLHPNVSVSVLKGGLKGDLRGGKRLFEGALRGLKACTITLVG